MTRYLSGLCVAGLGLCGGGWLILAAVAFGGESHGQGGAAGEVAARVNLATGAALVLVGCVTAAAWALAWRRRLRTVGVLAVPFPPVSRREARRNRRRLARDVRRAARLSKRTARASRRAVPRTASRREPAPPDLAAAPPSRGDAGSGVTHGGVTVGPDRTATAPAARPAAPAPGYGGNEYGGPQYGGTGHDGASAADVLGELRALLGPLLTAAAANQVPAQLPWPQSLPVWPAPPGPDQSPDGQPPDGQPLTDQFLTNQFLSDQSLTDQWLTGQWPAEVPPSTQWRPRQRPTQQQSSPQQQPLPQQQPPTQQERTPSRSVQPQETEPQETEPQETEPQKPASPLEQPGAPGTGRRPWAAAEDDELRRIADGEEAWW